MTRNQYTHTHTHTSYKLLFNSSISKSLLTPTKQHNTIQSNLNNNNTMNNHACDFCNESIALLYCRADSAKLCFTCDRQVHSTNPLFQKHYRSLLCNSCNSSPASIFCRTETEVLCQNCDWESHKKFGSVHDRRPVEGFNGCPAVSELMGFLGFEDLGNKSWDLCDGENDEEDLLLVWENPVGVVSTFDDLMVESGGGCGNFQAMGVPPLPKNRNAACGKHKEEILCQLREMAKIEPNFSGSLEDFEPQFGFEHQVPEKFYLMESSPGFENNAEPASVPSYETKPLNLGDYTGEFPDQGLSSSFLGDLNDMNHLILDKDSDVIDSSAIANGLQEDQACNPEDSKTIQVNPKAGLWELNPQERDSAISRYKEKRKTRRYDKHIRYESRKVRAESRTRIKGRFAKMDR